MNELVGSPVKKDIEDKLLGKIEKINREKSILIFENSFDPAAKTYSRAKKKLLEKFNIPYISITLPENFDENYIVQLIKNYKEDDKIGGIFLEMPLPSNVDSKKIIDYISYEKDVEGITTKSLGKLFAGDETIVAPTAMSIVKILEYYKIPIKGAHVVIINRSLVIGKPLIALLLNRDATVTICHTKTINLDFFIEKADIIVSGVSKPHFFNGKNIKQNAVIIDASINFENDKIVGDFDPEFFSNRSDLSYTPTPGGVGVVTNSIFLSNCINLLSR